MNIPRILLSAGEPAGIGPDLCLLLAQKPWPCSLTVLGDVQLYRRRAEELGLTLRIEALPPGAALAHEPGLLRVLEVPGAVPAVCGCLDPRQATYVLDCIRTGVLACLQGRADALVTGPVHKGVMNDAGIPFTGHTEFIAGLSGGQPVMLLATEGLRVALVTTHLPLSQVSAAIQPAHLRRVIEILHGDLQTRFGLREPRILVLGLNPHAGEGGHMGREEIDVIEPVLEALRREGLNLQGPLPADTAFLPKYLHRCDAVLAMYHDQGLPVLKFKGFGKAANITLGLPLVRTSVDHGTALDLAGTGQVDLGSLETALNAALQMCAFSPSPSPP